LIHKPLPFEMAGRDAHRSISSRNHHFRAVTTMSPLQHQKHVRLQETRPTRSLLKSRMRTFDKHLALCFRPLRFARDQAQANVDHALRVADSSPARP
jgi:hypothetical protein